MRIRLFTILLIFALCISNVYGVNPERQKGMRYAVEGHFAVGASSVENAMNFGFTASIGYQLNSNIFLGIGGGYINYPQYADGYVDNAFPIYADAKYNFNDKKISPFIQLKAGYDVSCNNGFYTNPTVGTSFALGRNMFLNVGLGYIIDINEGYTGSTKENKACGSVNLKVGFEF